MIQTIRHSGEGKTMKILKRSVVVRGQSAERDEDVEYTGSETTLKDNGNGEHMSLHVSKLIEHTTPKVNPNVNYGLWVIMMCRYRFYCNKHTALV